LRFGKKRPKFWQHHREHQRYGEQNHAGEHGGIDERADDPLSHQGGTLDERAKTLQPFRKRSAQLPGLCHCYVVGRKESFVGGKRLCKTVSRAYPALEVHAQLTDGATIGGGAYDVQCAVEH